MKVFFDTSVLVATVILQHPHHSASLEAYSRSEKSTGCCSAHSLAEIYATVTRLPGNFRMSEEQALLFVEDVRQRLTIIVLSEADYFSAISSAVTEGIVGGTIYDVLIGRCAMKSGAEVLYTWDVADFRRLGPEIAKRARTP